MSRHPMYFRRNRLKAKRLGISLSAAYTIDPRSGYAMASQSGDSDQYIDVTVFLRTGQQQQALNRAMMSAGIVQKDPIGKDYGMEFGVRKSKLKTFEAILQKIGLRFEKHEMY